MTSPTIKPINIRLENPEMAIRPTVDNSQRIKIITVICLKGGCRLLISQILTRKIRRSIKFIGLPKILNSIMRVIGIEMKPKSQRTNNIIKIVLSILPFPYLIYITDYY